MTAVDRVRSRRRLLDRELDLLMDEMKRIDQDTETLGRHVREVKAITDEIGVLALGGRPLAAAKAEGWGTS